MKNFRTLSSINQQFSTDTAAAIAQADLAFAEQLQTIARQLLAHAQQAPILLLAGPSGSGKTTTSYMLAKLLTESGMPTHCLSMDNYFRTISPKEHLEHIDLESPERLNTDLLNQQLQALLDGKAVQLPYYDFIHTRSSASDVILQRKPNELILLEGIHALNPTVIQLPPQQQQTIYVSVHTHLTCDEMTTLHPLYLRLLRRMLRDRKFRSRSIAETLELFPKVESGKQRFIKPYRCYAQYEVDTFFPYEPGIYRSCLLEELSQLPEQETVHKLKAMLSAAHPIAPQQIPNTALIQEFLGNSVYFNN